MKRSGNLKNWTIRPLDLKKAGMVVYKQLDKWNNRNYLKVNIIGENDLFVCLYFLRPIRVHY